MIAVRRALTDTDGHSAPPRVGAGLVHVILLVLVPSPHVAEQVVQGPLRRVALD